MRVRRLSLAGLVVLVASACGGGDGGTGPSGPNYENIAGAYAGVMAGISQGIALGATFSISLSQTEGAVTGTWSLTGTLDDGFDEVDIVGAGSVAGTVATGGNPSVNLTFRTPPCPSYQANFSGAYDAANRKLTISGPIDILSANCAVLLTYSATIILSR